jgi:23S rRNA (guanosine2251-2'-O)-methyltransferase
MSDRVEGRNPVLECLVRERRKVFKIWMDRGAKPERRVDAILEIAGQRSIQVERVERNRLDQMASGRTHNGVIADVEGLRGWSVKGLVAHALQAESPFLLVCDELAYEHNLGAILRSGLGFGVSGVILPTRRGASLSPVVQRVAMGAVEEVPVAREGIYAALKQLKRAGVRTLAADMGGRPASELDLRGPLAFVLGAEGRGISTQVRDRCDQTVSIPLAGGLESLNVSVAAAVLMYEKRRQDGWFD